MGASSVAPDYGLGYQQAMTMTLSKNGSITATSATPPLNKRAECDACPYCRDACDNVESCMPCQKKVNPMHAHCREPGKSWLMDALSSICPPQDKERPNTYTMCQLRRHNHADSAWILCGDTIYDATSYIRRHPGGLNAILRKTGGAVDCTEDLRFHSKRAQKEWRKFKVGTLRHCPHHVR
mmetsp:Transcript_19404/g.34066  ORF Transcript_19404/g.34066 Transcript_19404/m.34066 type:complete len:181 (+) Transcript_19404:67-609(+)